MRFACTQIKKEYERHPEVSGHSARTNNRFAFLFIDLTGNRQSLIIFRQHFGMLYPKHPYNIFGIAVRQTVFMFFKGTKCTIVV